MTDHIAQTSKMAEHIRQLELAEEGAKEAFGNIVESNDILKKRVAELESTIASLLPMLRRGEP